MVCRVAVFLLVEENECHHFPLGEDTYGIRIHPGEGILHSLGEDPGQSVLLLSEVPSIL